MADTNTYDSFQKVEKWTTKEKFNALDLQTIAAGTEYNLTGAIEESDLGSDLQTKINGKLNKPTTPSAESAVAIRGGSPKLVYGAVRNDSDKNVYTYTIAILDNDPFTDTVTEL